MSSENIIAVNIPNVVTIVLISTIGGMILAAARKAYMNKQGGS
jgi:hypothetical protein